MNYTTATIVVTMAQQKQAQSFFGQSLFTQTLSASGKAPATHCIACGPFSTEEVENFASNATFTCFFKFGEKVNEMLNELGLVKIVEEM